MGTSNTADDLTVYTIPQVAELLSCSRETVAKLTRDGRLPSFRLGAKYGVRVSHAALAAFINERAAS